MTNTVSLFTQILSLFQRSDFVRHVREPKTERHARGFSCWSQFVAMLFCQLAKARSLREIADGLKSCEGKLKHLGLEVEPKRSTLSYANAHRSTTRCPSADAHAFGAPTCSSYPFPSFLMSSKRKK